ncbi:TetR/AcrR family transcriptional regulator [Nocardioides pocheonensis]|uniref:TetR/AcrR family transcriptional regulator n=1 Tax=Nocardioides pocheonensis TaxID=661485 RepID=UPI001FE4198E|nr:TetR family transcriptional regulator [Nocardioides pocheonensis]
MDAVTPRPALSALLGVDEAGGPSGQSVPQGGWRARLIAQAAELTRSGGWQAITMAKLADRVGVSRQTVYNEIGSKRQLAEAMIMHELEVFLQAVDAAFEEHPESLVDAIREAATRVLEMARTNPLLHAVLSASHGAESALLPLLTTQVEPLIEAAHGLVRRHLDTYDHGLDEDRIDPLVDMVIRLVLSHVTAPSTSPRETADNIAWIAARVLASARAHA